jgi:uncharacterized protein DUF6973
LQQGGNSVSEQVSVDNLDRNGLECAWEDFSQVLAVGPIDAVRAETLSREATQLSKDLGLTGQAQGHGAAFRHCYWNCRMAQEIGEDQAEEVGDTHEVCGNNEPDKSAMDYTNNEKGRKLAAEPDTNCSDACLWSLYEGDLRTEPAPFCYK